MSDKELVQLAQNFYQKHKLALDFIFEQRPDWKNEAGELLKEIIDGTKGLAMVGISKKYVTFAPEAWAPIDAFNCSPMSKGSTTGHSLTFNFTITDQSIRLVLVLGPTSNDMIRAGIHSYCLDHVNVFKGTQKKLSREWSTLYSQQFLKFKEGQQDAVQNLRAEIQKEFDQFVGNELPNIQKLLEAKFKNWRNPNSVGFSLNSNVPANEQQKFD
jgi:hypothetical protein